MATVTKLKAAVNNKNLPILGEDGNLYSYYYGRYFNKIVEKGYTPTSVEKTALEAFIQDGIDNGWIDLVKYFLPLIGDSSHLIAAAVPLIDRVGDYEMAEYDGTENFTNSFEINPVNNKIKYYRRSEDITSINALKSPCTVSSMNGGISFSGYIPTPEVFNDGIKNDYYASVKKYSETGLCLGIRYHEATSGNTKNHELAYLVNASDEETTKYPLNYPSKATIESLNSSGKSLIVNYAIYKADGVVKRLRNYLDANGGKNYTNTPPDTPITYMDLTTNTNKMYFGDNSSYNISPKQKFGCVGVLDAPKVTESLITSYNNAVFTLMDALGK